VQLRVFFTQFFESVQNLLRFAFGFLQLLERQVTADFVTVSFPAVARASGDS
jgi:hypothetical protein